MKVALVNTSEIGGGAAIAVKRLHQGLLDLGVHSRMLVELKVSDDRTVIGSPTRIGQEWSRFKSPLDDIPLRLYRQRARVHYSLQWLPSKIDSQLQKIAPDIVNLHWIGSSYFPVEKITKFNRPIVWTLHDMWAFTGGCHYSQECDRYQDSCGRCPILKSDRDWDLSRWLWQRKVKAWQNIDMTIVTPSRWLAKCAAASSLFKDLRIEVIPNGLDIQRYKPFERQLARKIVGLPLDKKIILFGAVSATSNLRKGYSLLMPALQKLKHYQTQQQMELVIFGASQPKDIPDFGLEARYLGRLNDDISIALLYSAVDVFVAPSIQDNLPNTVMEALACGTPSVAFNIGGMPDLIDHQQNGYLATAYDPEDLAYGIFWLLENQKRWQSLSTCASTKVEQKFTVEKQAETYRQLYKDILIGRNATEYK